MLSAIILGGILGATIVGIQLQPLLKEKFPKLFAPKKIG